MSLFIYNQDGEGKDIAFRYSVIWVYTLEISPLNNLGIELYICDLYSGFIIDVKIKLYR